MSIESIPKDNILNKKIELLNNIYICARGVLRYQGIDKIRYTTYINKLYNAVNEMNNFEQNLLNLDEEVQDD